MKKFLPQTSNEKIDSLLSWLIVFIIMTIYLFLNSKGGSSILTLLALFLMYLPYYLRRKKQFKKIKHIKELLDLSTDELRNLAKISPNDLVSWNDRKDISMPTNKWYELEEKMEDQYFLAYKKRYKESDFANTK